MSGYTLPTQLHVSEPVDLTARECPRCHTDSVLDFPVHIMSPLGVVELPPVAGCLRCMEELTDTPDR